MSQCGDCIVHIVNRNSGVSLSISAFRDLSCIVTLIGILFDSDSRDNLCLNSDNLGVSVNFAGDGSNLVLDSLSLCSSDLKNPKFLVERDKSSLGNIDSSLVISNLLSNDISLFLEDLLVLNHVSLALMVLSDALSSKPFLSVDQFDISDSLDSLNNGIFSF